MMMVNQKNVVKSLIHFAKRELREKKPLGVLVLRMRNEKIISEGGPLKILSMSQASPIHYLVEVNYEHHFRLSKDNLLVYVKQRPIQKLHKLTVIEYRFPNQ